MTFIKTASSTDCTVLNKAVYENEYIKKHLENITNAEYRLSSSTAFSLLADMLSQHFGINLSKEKISENEYGKPELSGENVYFNISHSNGAVVCAVSDKPVGVDIEYIKEMRPGIINRCFTDNEKKAILSSRDFYRLWTLKEAYVKMLGLGISHTLSLIEFTFAGVIKCTDRDEIVTCNFKSYDRENYVISVASYDDNIIF